MQKSFIFTLLVAFGLSSTIVSTVHSESALEQLQGAVESSGNGANANYDDDDHAHAASGASFDGNIDTTPPAVDLTRKDGIVDPNDLKKYDPKPPSLKPSYVPPLP